MDAFDPDQFPPQESGARTWPWIIGSALFSLVLLGLALGPSAFGVWSNGGEPVVSVAIKGGDELIGEPLPQVGLPDAVPENEILIDVSREEAMRINGSVPFSDAPIVPAAPFASALEDTDRDRARACLAIAAVYEAGSDVNDQKPVMQVVLNRVRHPAFPNSVCEVVFQGSELATGCQFSFTCDGSMARTRPPEGTLAKAQGLAEWMLVEGIDERVGHATHYHTDWVVPYWSPKLNKLTQINTHIFFSWPGGWGRKGAFRAAPSAQEAMVPQLASYSVAHSDDPSRIELDAEEWADLNALEVDDFGDTDPIGGTVAAAPASQSFVIPTKKLGLPQGMTPGRWSLNAAGLCGDLPACRVVGWSDAARTPAQLNPASLSQSPPDLVFVQDLRNRVQTAHWDCAKWNRAGTSQCLGSTSDRLALVNGSRLN